MSVRLAIIANEQTPYRLHLHRRIAREMPEVELWSLFTHETASSPWRFEEDQAIRPVRFSRSSPAWVQGGRIVRWLEEHNIQAIVLFGYNDLARLRIVRWASAKRVPCFLFGDSNIRGDQPSVWKGFLKCRYVSWVLRQTAGVFHCGRLGREYFLRYGVSASRLYTFPYEPDYALFSNPPLERASVCRRYGLPQDRRFLIFAGRMVPAKRPELLLSAFEELAAIRPEWDLVMVGDGPLKRKLQDHFDTRVHWLGFIDDSAELASLYSACDVFVLPSDFEPWGVVLTEAACQLALAASSVVGAAADVIEEGLNGTTFVSGDLGDLKRALKYVTDPANTQRMKAASPIVIRKWRNLSDPILSLTQALSDAGVRPAAVRVYAG